MTVARGKHDGLLLKSLYEWLRGRPESFVDGNALEAHVRERAKESGFDFAYVSQLLRLALTGEVISPPIYSAAVILGYQETLTRIISFVRTDEDHDGDIHDFTSLTIDQAIVPSGVRYEWKRISVLGHECRDYMNKLRDDGWRDVPSARHPELAFAPDAVIRRYGLILMERSRELCDEAIQESLEENSRLLGISGAPRGHDFGALDEGLRREVDALQLAMIDRKWPEPELDVVGYLAMTLTWRVGGRARETWVRWTVSVFCEKERPLEPICGGRGEFQIARDERILEHAGTFFGTQLAGGTFHGICAHRSVDDIANIINKFRWVLEA